MILIGRAYSAAAKQRDRGEPPAGYAKALDPKL